MEKSAHTSDKPVVTVDHLSLSFGSNQVLRDFSLAVNGGENVVVIGKSGSGKSVLIKCIVRLIEADKGEITVLGEDICGMEREQLDHLRRRIGFLFQSDALYDSMTVRENLLFPLRTDEEQKSPEEKEELVLEALRNVGLEKTIDQYPSELSGGMKKRVSLARTLMLKPEIIFYDEPTTGLDSITGAEISELIVEIKEKYKAAALIISHDLYCARTTSDRVAVLIDGKCHAIGTYEELENSDDEKVKQFFHHGHENKRK
jgi:phospholipid/cholesterol/gamma-HCH transport system ATP-binding protein